LQYSGFIFFDNGTGLSETKEVNGITPWCRNLLQQGIKPSDRAALPDDLKVFYQLQRTTTLQSTFNLRFSG
jgi:hypothetical protein